MRIAYIGQKGIPAKSGGVEKHVEEMAIRMAKKGHTVFVYARNNYINPKLKKYKGVNIITLPSIPTKNLDAISHTFLATGHALFQKYDLIHYHSIGPSSLLFIIKLLKRKTVVIATYHCQDYFHKKWSILAKAYLKLGEYIMVNFSDKIIVVSKNLKEYIKNKYHKNSTVVTNGMNVFPAKKSHYLKKWGLRESNYIVYIGRLIRHKGVHYLIEAFKRLENDHLTRGKKLVIIGDGFYTDDYVEDLHNLARGRENIIFTGNLVGEELRQLFSYNYIFVQPSESEGLSLALLEAMGYGNAIICSDIKENKEPLNEETALFFCSKNDVDLEKKLVYLINNPILAKEMGKKSQLKAQKEYSWEAKANQLEDIYQDILLAKKKINLIVKINERNI